MPDPDPRIIDLAGDWLIAPPCGEWKRIRIPSAWQTVLGADFHGSARLKRTMLVDRAWIDSAVVSPHKIEDLGAVEDAIGPLHEEAQQLKLA